LLRYINRALCGTSAVRVGLRAKSFILLQFDGLWQRRDGPVVQCTKIRLTAPGALPTMELLRRTNRREH
jgi:hypothetical protein